MLEKNYTNLEDKGRFGFSASGKYRAPYKFEHIVIAVMIGAGIAAVVLIFFAIASFVKQDVNEASGDSMIVPLAAGVSFIVIGVAVIAAAIVIIKFVMQGFWCSYLADEDKFTAIVGGTSHTIYYSEVQTVHFLPRMARGSVRGYTVTVKINGACEEFGIVSDNYIAENTTPFYIIKERVELIRAAEERERQLSAASKGLSVNVSEKPDEMQSAMSRLEKILGKDAEMPGVSAKNVPLPDISQRVSPTVNGYADDMPAVGADGKIVRSAPTYFDSDGREHDVNDVVAQGTFRVVVKTWTAVIMIVIAAAIWFGAFMLLRDIYYGDLPVGKIIAVLLAPFLFGTFINYMRNGRAYNYRANGREFVITSKGKPDERFLYTDVQSVTYKKMEFLWFVKGYKVEILTRFGITKYNYVFPGFGKPQPTRNLPFEVIREKIEQK
ncbi:MAG: hypothetical protein K2N56_03600 [Oscillospiraceae bacterium]|nr:hypothetical protein [Oscillospiraceae bacterium]